MFCNKCGNQMEDNEAFCGKCGNRIGGNPQTVTAQPPAKSKKPLIALISIPLVVLIAGVSIFALRGTEKSATAAPSTASSIAEVSQSAAEVNTEPEEPEIAPWKQLYFDVAKERCSGFLGHYGMDVQDISNYGNFGYGVHHARLYDLDEDGVPEVFVDFTSSDITTFNVFGIALTVRNGVLVSDKYLEGGETAPAVYVSEIRRNPQTGAYLGINEDTDTDYFLYENGQWRFLFRIYQMKVYGADTAEGKELEERLTGEAGYYDSTALDAFTAPYSEDVECAQVNFTNDKSWVSIAPELIDLFNGYDGDNRFDVPIADRLQMPWGETYAEIMARFYEKQENVKNTPHDGYPSPFYVTGFQIIDTDGDSIPEMYVSTGGEDHLIDRQMASYLYYADKRLVNPNPPYENLSYYANETKPINKTYRHKDTGRLLVSRASAFFAGGLVIRLEYLYADTFEPYLFYNLHESVLEVHLDDTLTPGPMDFDFEDVYINGELTSIVVHTNPKDSRLNETIAAFYDFSNNDPYIYQDELGTNDPYVAAFLAEYLKDFEEVDAIISSFECPPDSRAGEYTGFDAATLAQAQAWVKSLPGAMD